MIRRSKTISKLTSINIPQSPFPMIIITPLQQPYLKKSLLSDLPDYELPIAISISAAVSTKGNSDFRAWVLTNYGKVKQVHLMDDYGAMLFTLFNSRPLKNFKLDINQAYVNRIKDLENEVKKLKDRLLNPDKEMPGRNGERFSLLEID